MIALLDIVLATLAAIATIIAIFGDTWNRRLRRLTRLGCTVVALTTLTFVFGIAKEIVSARSAATDRQLNSQKQWIVLEAKSPACRSASTRGTSP